MDLHLFQEARSVGDDESHERTSSATTRAVDQQIVDLNPCDLHKDISVIADRPTGVLRYIYAKINVGQVESIALFVLIEPIKGIPCFQMGWATIESMRGRGLATEVTTKGLDELRTGLKRNGVKQFYLEAVISESNQPSNALA